MNYKVSRNISVVFIIACFISACNSPDDTTKSVASSAEQGTKQAKGSDFEKISVLALGPADGRAVITKPDGKMQVLKVGDTIPGTKATVMQVLHDKLVVEDTVEKSGSAPEKQIVWLFKSKNADEKSRIQRFDDSVPGKDVILHPSQGESTSLKSGAHTSSPD